jgi:(1->4)-alpha-D-glucan 1-alpha-D-glucosylmutase
MRIPTATYRIQVNSGFGFRQARKLVPYLSDLGISDIYASPILKARKGSLHGYDVVDPCQLNPELGASSDRVELAEELRKYGVGWLQDVVPNHMAFDSENHMLMDVLENGQEADFYRFFDIEWDHMVESLKGRVLAPFLGGFYGDSLETGEITLDYSPSGLTVHYYDLTLPLRIESYVPFLTHQLARLRRRLSGDHPDLMTFLAVLSSLKTLSSSRNRHERHQRIKVIKTTLWDLYSRNGEIHRFIDENIERFNGEKGNPESYGLLNTLLSEQHFRLSFWKVATEEINYRRFFNINELISLRMEDEEVFAHTHALIFKLLEEKWVTGLRIDHVDGLYDPKKYLKTLREKTGEIYLIVEKILGPDEALPSSWPVQGTTGYDFMNYVNGLFCQRQKEKEFNRIYRSFTGFRTLYQDLVADNKRLIIGKHMAGDIDNLAYLLKALSSRDRYGSDITLYGLKRALIEVMAQFPVYRTYIDGTTATNADQFTIESAVERAKQSSPALVNELDFIHRSLLLGLERGPLEGGSDQRIHFVMKFQQLTGPLMAKGLEDTSLYVYNRLLSLNEVGGHPNWFGIPLGAFHDFNKKRTKSWPHSLNATSTHDTKRGEDARARLNVLSEMPKEWETRIKTWRKINGRARKRTDRATIPDRNDEYFLYQALVGACPFQGNDDSQFTERVKEYVVKAVREAKVHTAWLKPDIEYEKAYVSFVEKILDPSEGNAFLEDFLPFQKRVSHYGIFNSLSQTLIKVTAPGVPDFYQGTELWDLSLVDPDNRRPVDYDRRRRYLRQIRENSDSNILSLIQDLFRDKEDGRIKLFLIYRALKARKDHTQVFQKGTYFPLDITGKFENHIIAFSRTYGGTRVMTIAPRFLTALVDEGEYPLGRSTWHDTQIQPPEGSSGLWKNVITDQVMRARGRLIVGDVLKHFPVALLINEDSP